MTDQSAAEKILVAARKVFILKGMTGARMQDIANEAGINKALLHYYFRSKEKLFEVIFKEASNQLAARVNSILQSDCPLFEKIETFCKEHIELMMENPFIPLFVINEMNKQSWEFLHKIWEEKRPGAGSLIAQIEEDARKGIIKSVNPHQLLMNMISMCIFPFLGKPAWQFITEMDDLAFTEFMELRKKEVPRFIIESIKK